MSLFTSLSTLESAGLIQVAKVEPDLEYLFRHSMVQDAAYASLLESDRKRLHLAVGEAIEQLYSDRQKELAAILGYHFKEAGQDERALHYFLIAGDEALSVYANQEAEIQYRSALELSCCSGPQIAWLYSGLAEALYRQSQFDESLNSFRNGIEIYKSLADSDGMAKLYARSARVEWYAGKRAESLRTCLNAMELLKDTPDSQGKAVLIHETARAYYFNGNSEKALPLCRHALELADQLGNVSLKADALATLGILAGVRPEESLYALRKAVELAEANGMLQVAVRAHINLGTMTRTWLADNETALKNFQRAAELGRLRGAVSEELLGVSSYISCLFGPGRLNEIEAELPHLESLIQQVPNSSHMMVMMKFINAVLLYHRGDWDSSLSILRQCLEESLEQKNQESFIQLMDQISWIILEKNHWGEPADLNQAEKLILDAHQYLKQESSNDLLWVYSRLSILYARQGRITEAEHWLENLRQELSTKQTAWEDRFIAECAVEIASEKQDWDAAIHAIEKMYIFEQHIGFRVGSAHCLLWWADLLIKRKNTEDVEKAQTMLRQAIAEFDEMGIGHYPEIAQKRLDDIQARLRTQMIDNVQMTTELRKARQIQESLLPANPPLLPGWDIAVLLEPAHETSGDFYDFLTLLDGRLGIVIADVTDKGTGAALYMAMSRSLWRTFAINYPQEPEQAMTDTNQRILADTHGGLFITLLYGILDPQTGDFSYCSAGHHPALLLRTKDNSIEELKSTGIPLGVYEDSGWERVTINIAKGDMLALYTDGITDAQNSDEEFYGLERFREALSKQAGKAAQNVRDALRSDVRKWVASAPQFDDMTLMVVVREQ